MESLDRLRTCLSRLEVIPGWDALTLGAVAFFALAVVAAFAAYGWSVYRRSRLPGGIDWSREFGSRREPGLPSDPRDRFFARLKFGCIALFLLYLGAEALITGHMSGRTSRYGGQTYTADGVPVYVAGGLLCAGGLALALVALFADAEILNRPIGRRGRLP